uniref:Uncharacterized protein n=1 Tax=Oryza meridionalis TaxID=40149 RepID=A0A0E0C9N0_9ORYZ
MVAIGLSWSTHMLHHGTAMQSSVPSSPVAINRSTPSSPLAGKRRLRRLAPPGLSSFSCFCMALPAARGWSDGGMRSLLGAA